MSEHNDLGNMIDGLATTADSLRCTRRNFPTVSEVKQSLPQPTKQRKIETFSSNLNVKTLKQPLNPCLNEQDNVKKVGATPKFPLKLHEMLNDVEDKGKASVVSWQPHGRCFVVHLPTQFVNDILPLYFKHSKLTSFQRQLNLYGFRRLSCGPDKGGYYHDLFLRGKIHLCRRLFRVKVKGTKVRVAANPSSEPNFYEMPPLSRKQRSSAVPSKISDILSPLIGRSQTMSFAGGTTNLQNDKRVKNHSSEGNSPVVFHCGAVLDAHVSDISNATQQVVISQYPRTTIPEISCSTLSSADKKYPLNENSDEVVMKEGKEQDHNIHFTSPAASARKQPSKCISRDPLALCGSFNSDGDVSAACAFLECSTFDTGKSTVDTVHAFVSEERDQSIFSDDTFEAFFSRLVGGFHLSGDEDIEERLTDDCQFGFLLDETVE